MASEFETAIHRIEVFARQVLAPAVFPQRVPLRAEIFQSRAALPYSVAIQGPYTPVDSALRWGPVWSTAWFRVSGRVPDSIAGACAVLRFSTGTEATLWRDGIPHQGLDANHDFAPILDAATTGQAVELFVEAACNRPFGVSLFPWESHEDHLRWSEADPGRLELCELAAFDEAVWRLWKTAEFARQLAQALPAGAPQRPRILDALERAVRVIDPRDVRSRCHEAERLLLDGLQAGGDPARSTCVAVGHAHIDTAWLWRVRESRRKCMRTFSTVLRLMERHPEFRFIASQAQQYAWIESDAPELFDEIRRRVQDGRWEAGGAMWIEPDCNVPCGESLVRQIIHGTRYWEERFGAAGRQAHLYLPDTFGFCAALPQLMRLAGLRTFITNKLSWNDTVEFPHVTFVWRGLDGSEVLAHCTPGGDYNSDNRPAMLLRGVERVQRLAPPDAQRWLQPYGYGDGGGGPTEETILHADLSRDCAGLPRVEHGRVDSFCESLHRSRTELRQRGGDLPIWDGELYLQYHRGTYTTQAWLKRANRRLERDLRTAEWLTAFGPDDDAGAHPCVAADSLAQAWQALLCSQFHDILPGSSIAEVYEDTRAELTAAQDATSECIAEGISRWSSVADGRGMSKPILILSPRSFGSSAVVDSASGPLFVPHLSALGMVVVDAAQSAAPPTGPVRVDGRRLSNGLIDVEIDELGRIGGLRCAQTGREACGAAPGGGRTAINQLVLYTDVPGHYDAWEIARHDVDPGSPVLDPPVRCEVVERHPLRAVIEVERPLGRASRIVQRYVLEAGSPRVNIHSRVDWHESRTLLRATFPVDVRARRAAYETQFGYIERTTHANTAWDQAMFEVPAQRWIDLSEPGLGVGLLNDCKYGHSCRGNVMGLSLLRSPVFPDPRADRGAHEFTYSVMPHGGDWRAAGVAREAEALNVPLLVRPLTAGPARGVHGRWAPFELATSGGAAVEVTAAKHAEDGDGRRVLRLCETAGGGGTVRIAWRRPVARAAPIDLLERPLAAEGFAHDADAGVTTLQVRPFQVWSLSIQFA